MRDGPRSKQKVVTRGKLVAAALVAFLDEGYEGADLRSIAAAAGVSIGAVYFHWPNKAALFLDVMGRKPVTEARGDYYRQVLEQIAVMKGEAGELAREALT